VQPLISQAIKLTLMIFLAAPPTWHTILFSVLGFLAVLALTIIGFFIVRWMNSTEVARKSDNSNLYQMHRADMQAIHEQRTEDLQNIESSRLEDNKLTREAFEKLTGSITELAEETRKKALSDARFETKVLFQVKDFQDKMLVLSIDIGNHKIKIGEIENEIKNIKKRHKANHGEDI
jgi:hypothetical protein